VDSTVRVSGIDDLGPCYYDVDVAVGDVLFEVDGVGVQSLSRIAVGKLLVGPVGSRVTLGMYRAHGQREFKAVHSKVRRQNTVQRREVHFNDAAGLGLEMVQGHDLCFYIKTCARGSPAYEGGQLYPHDKVIGLNGLPVTNMRVMDILRIFKSRPLRKPVALDVIRGPVELQIELDPLDPKREEVLQPRVAQLDLKSLGLKLAVEKDPPSLRIVHMYPGGSAEQTLLLQVGDVITKVDGKSIGSILDGNTGREEDPNRDHWLVTVALDCDEGHVVVFAIQSDERVVEEENVALMRRGKTVREHLPLDQGRFPLLKPGFNVLPLPLLVSQGVPGIGGDALVVDEKKLGIIFVKPRVGAVGLQVHEVKEHGSAARTGQVAAGDVVVAVDCHSLNGRTDQETVALLDGPTGSNAVLTILRPGEVARVVKIPREMASYGRSAAEKALYPEANIKMTLLREVVAADPHLEQLRRRFKEGAVGPPPALDPILQTWGSPYRGPNQ